MFLILKKFIETILEHKAKLNHNIDITPVSSTIYDHHTTSEPQNIRENRNGDTSDTEYNVQRKHDKKLTWKNKKSDDKNKEK